MKWNNYQALLIMLITAFLSGTLQTAAAETRDTLPARIFPRVERDAGYIEGIDAWKQFLVSHVRGEVALKKGAPAGRHQAYVRFLIDTTGRIDTVMVVKDPGYGMAEELKRVILLSSGKWQPAILEGGKKSRSMRGQPFTFLVNQK